MLQVLKKIWDVVSTLVVILVLLCAVLLVGTRLMGIQVFAVISGSMEPEYPIGSLICVKDISPAEVEVGDVITYVLPNGTPSTHRVIRISDDTDYFYTKGDANPTPDKSPVFYKNLIGTPTLTVPYLGYVAHFVQNPPGTYIAITLGVVFLLFAFLPDFLKKKPAPAPATERPPETTPPTDEEK